MELRANYHTHTTFCDGGNTPKEMVEAAIKKKFFTLGFSGHMDPAPGVSMDVNAYVQEIKGLQAQYRDQIAVLRGVEIDNVLSFENAQDVEYRIGSTHFVPVPGQIAWGKALSQAEGEAICGDDLICVDDNPDVLHQKCQQWYGGDFLALAADYFAFESQVVSRTKPAFIGHFDLITRFNDLEPEAGGGFLDEHHPRYLAAAKDAMERILSEGINLLEVNCGAMNRGRKGEPYPSWKLLRLWRSLGGEVLVNADAHHKDLLDGGFGDALRGIHACGFDGVHVLVREETEFPAVNTCQDSRFTKGKEQVPLYWKRLAIS